MGVLPASGLELLPRIAKARTCGELIDRTMSVLGQEVGGSIVSFNRMDLPNRTATVAFRPYRPEHEAAVTGVARLLDEHPLFRWYTTHDDWSPVRISDAVPWERFRDSRLVREVLAPVGACHGIALMLVRPTPATEWVFFMINRAERDFTDSDLAICTRLQPALVALYLRLAGERDDPPSISLTRRELAILGWLADGLTAEAIAHRGTSSPATVRKHLQNLYAKLGTSDRLGAVIRARDLGLLRSDDLSREFSWSVRADLQDHLSGSQ